MAQSDWQQYNRIVLNPSSEKTSTMSVIRKWVFPGIFICLIVTCAFYFKHSSVINNPDAKSLVISNYDVERYNVRLGLSEVLTTAGTEESTEENSSIMSKVKAKLHASESAAMIKHSAQWIADRVDVLFEKWMNEIDSKTIDYELSKNEELPHIHPSNESDEIMYYLTSDILKPMDNSLDKTTLPMNRQLNSVSQASCVVYPYTKCRDYVYDCRKLEIHPNPYVCLYTAKEDVYISAQIINDGVWEIHVLEHVASVLGSDSNLGFIDLGANIGVFSLVAAKLGHQVVSVEPYAESANRLITAACMEGVQDRITVLHNALSDTSGTMDLIMNENNQGDVRIKAPSLNTTIKSRDVYYGYSHTNSITLDHILPYINFTRAIIKIDIQGFEHHVFRKATRLLDSVYVSYIFMEWIIIREFYGSEVTSSRDKDLAQDLVDFLYARGYQAYSSVTRKLLVKKMWYAWPDDVYWKHELVDLDII